MELKAVRSLSFDTKHCLRFGLCPWRRPGGCRLLWDQIAQDARAREEVLAANGSGISGEGVSRKSWFCGMCTLGEMETARKGSNAEILGVSTKWETEGLRTLDNLDHNSSPVEESKAHPT